MKKRKELTDEERDAINRAVKMLHVWALSELELLDDVEADMLKGKIGAIKNNDVLELFDTVVCFVVKELRELKTTCNLLRREVIALIRGYIGLRRKRRRRVRCKALKKKWKK